MKGGFGRRPRMCPAKASRAAARSSVLAAALGLVLACSGEHIIVAEERGHPDRDGDDPGGSGAVGSEGEAGVPLLATCPASPAARRELLACWPSQHIGTWLGYFIGVPHYQRLDGTREEFPTGDLLLRLDLDGTGKLRFAEAATADEGDPCEGVPLSECPELGRLRAGFDYGLEEIELQDANPGTPSAAPGQAELRSGARMSFRIRLGEPWQEQCAPSSVAGGPACQSGACAKSQGPPSTSEAGTGEPVCLCDALGCLVRAPSLRIGLRMSEDGLALRGDYTPEGGGVAEARLEFLRVLEP
jgi:hypothetical protein